MIDSNSQFFAILTAVGEAKQANATALGVPWTFKEMGVGDANNTDPIPDRMQTRLINEWRRAPVNQVRTDPANPNVVIAEQVIPSDVGGRWIREIALYDADGDMVAVANCAPSFKPLLAQGTGKTQIIRMNFIVANTAQIVLKIDPAVVLATREYVDNAVIEALAKLDFKHSALVATTANIVLSGLLTIDGVLLPADARVLVKDQAQAKENGLYVVSSTGVWKRASDADSSLEVTPGLFVSIEKGTVNGDSVWQLVTDGQITLGTTPLVFEMAVGRTGISAGSYANVTVDKYGRVIAGTNPTTLAGHGINDTYTKAEIEALLAQASSAIPINYVSGLILSMNVAAPTTSVDLSVGVVRGAAGSPVVSNAVMSGVLQAAGAWSAGVGGNKIDTGVRTVSTWYHCFILRRTADGLADFLLSASVDAPTVPAGYSLVARLKGRAVKTDAAGAIIPFINYGSSTNFKSPQRDMRITGGAARSTLVTVSGPPGVSVLMKHYAAVVGENCMIFIRSPDADEIAIGPIANNVTNQYAGGIGLGNTGLNSENVAGYCEARTNALGQVVAQVFIGSSYTIIEAWLLTVGWKEE
jgi:hypothetical protein